MAIVYFFLFLLLAKHIVYLASLPCLAIYSHLHYLKAMNNPEGEESLKCVNGGGKISYAKRDILNYIDGYYRWAIYLTSQIPSHRIRRLLYKMVFRVKMDKHTVFFYGVEICGSWLL